MEQNQVAVSNGGALTIVKEKGLIDTFLTSIDVKPKSKRTYQRALRQFTEFMKNNSTDKDTINYESRDNSALTLDDITSQQLQIEDIIKYKQFLINDCEYKACTVSSYITAVKQLFTWLESKKLYPNIANGVKGAKHQRGFKKDALTVDEVRTVLSSINTTTVSGKRDYAIVNLLVRTGLRTIELERAKIEDIKINAGDTVLWVQGKGRDAKDDLVVLTREVKTPLNNYLACREDVSGSAPLFTSESNKNKGGNLVTRSLGRIVKNVLVKAGFDDERITPHSLRHTAVTLALLAGAKPQEVMGMARHSNINTTMIYAHNIDRVKNAPENKIAELLS